MEFIELSFLSSWIMVYWAATVTSLYSQFACESRLASQRFIMKKLLFYISLIFKNGKMCQHTPCLGLYSGNSRISAAQFQRWYSSRRFPRRNRCQKNMHKIWRKTSLSSHVKCRTLAIKTLTRRCYGSSPRSFVRRISKRTCVEPT